MFKTTCNFCGCFNWMLRGWTDRWNLYWLVCWNLWSISKLTFVVHAPGIDIPSHWDCNSKLFSHFDLSDLWKSSRIILLHSYRLFTRRNSPCVDIRGRLNTISKNNFSWILTDRFFFYLVVFRNVLVVTTCAPLVYWSIVKNTSRMNETTSNCLDSHSLKHLYIVKDSIEELNLFEVLLCLPRSVSKSEGRTITAWKKSVHASSHNSVDWTTLNLLDSLFTIKKIETLVLCKEFISHLI